MVGPPGGNSASFRAAARPLPSGRSLGYDKEPMSTQAADTIPADFVAAVPFGQALLDALAQDEIEVAAITLVDAKTGTWTIAVVLPFSFQERLELPRATIAVVQAVEGTQHLTPRHASWWGPQDALVLACSAGAGRVRIPGFWGQQATIRFEEDDEGTWGLWGYGGGSVLAALAHAMRSFDLFDRRDPLPLEGHPSRGAVIRELEDTLLAGQSVGLFGLRKVGKTSVARTIAELIDPHWFVTLQHYRLPSRSGNVAPRRVVVWLDLQGLTDRTGGGLAGRLSDLLRLRVGIVPTLSRGTHGQAPLGELAASLEYCASRQAFVCFILDEQDLLFSDGRSPQPTGIVEVFALLRAHAQHTGLCSVLLIGRDPRWLQAPTMDGVTSPTPGWVRTRWLAPLARQEADEVFRHIAARTGLEAHEETLALVYEWTGGHPFLLRQFGSAFWQVIAPGARHGPHTSTQAFHEEALAAFLERDAVVETCREVEDLLSSRSKADASLFWRIAGGASLPATYWDDRAAVQLRKFGLLAGTRENPEVARVWRWWAAFAAPTLARTA